MALRPDSRLSLVLKPPAGAGSQATYQIEGPVALASALASANPGPGREALLEEFITGDEHSFDTISIGGRHVWHSLTHYLPPPLDAMRNPWIQWSVLLPREIDGPQYDDIRQVAFRAPRRAGDGDRPEPPGMVPAQGRQHRDLRGRRRPPGRRSPR